MEEEARRVRAVSDHTGRPYFSINYKLSLSGRDLKERVAKEESEASAYNATTTRPLTRLRKRGSASSEETPHSREQESEEENDDEDLEVGVPPRRGSTVDLGTAGITVLAKTPGSLLPVVATAATDILGAAPLTPKSAAKRKVLPAATQQNPTPVTGSVDTGSSSSTIRRVKSALTVRQLEFNRTAPAADLRRTTLQKPMDGETLSGFVTCLNSRDVSKYRAGQRYRDGHIIGLDKELGKLIVYNARLPQGALIVMKTRDAARYERGFVIEDLHGKATGIVHAVDRESNVLVVNTSPNIGYSQANATKHGRHSSITTVAAPASAAAPDEVLEEHTVNELDDARTAASGSASFLSPTNSSPIQQKVGGGRQ